MSINLSLAPFIYGNGQVTMVKVAFQSSSIKDVLGDRDAEAELVTYTYKAPTNMNLKPDDMVVVQVRNRNSNKVSYKVSRVVEIDVLVNPNLLDIEYAWVVDKIDLTTYEETLKLEKQLRDSLIKTQYQSQIQNMQSLLEETLGIDPEKRPQFQITKESKK